MCFAITQLVHCTKQMGITKRNSLNKIPKGMLAKASIPFLLQEDIAYIQSYTYKSMKKYGIFISENENKGERNE